MPRNMSFALTTEQIRSRTKTVTRRRGWKNLKPGQLFWAVKKAMGLKPGEKIERLALLRCISNRTEALDQITAADVAREGFPGQTASDFMRMFCSHIGGDCTQEVQRIEFEYAEASS